MRNAQDLQRYIDEQGIDAELLLLEEDTPTVEAAAQVVGCQPEQIGKSVMFLINGEPNMVVASGLTRICYKKLAAHFEVSRRRIKLAKADEVLEIGGFPVGTVPPFGHKTALPTLIEANTLKQDELFVGGGAINALVRITSEELQKTLQTQVIDLAKDE